VSLESGTRPEVLRSMVDYTYLTLAVRTAADPGTLTSAIKHEVWTVDKDLPIYDVATMEEVMEENLGQRRFDSFMMGIFGGLALLLAGVGIYGVLSSTVQQRTQEIGVRMALGAQQGDVLRMVMSYGLKLVLMGMAPGLLAGFILTRLLASMLFGVSPANPLTYLGVCVGLTLVAALACYLPARVAVQIDPSRAKSGIASCQLPVASCQLSVVICRFHHAS
jgi:ABC-type antimicrobial peptide transport system permease subunit